MVRQSIRLFALALLGAANHANAKQACESMASVRLPDTTITLVQTVATGAFTPPTPLPWWMPRNAYDVFKTLPSFCRISATIKPTTDSEIKIEVWMPESGWNGKFQGTGNGGWGGDISYVPVGQALARGYAAASTDTGHSSSSGGGRFALGHPEKVIDFGYRAVHEMTLKAKALIAVFYGNQPRQSYWNGCSTGGHQGLAEAQRFPRDYNGIIAGAPGANWTHEGAGGFWAALALVKTPASNLPNDKLTLIHKAVIDACDRLDGLKDGVIDDPRRCHFDPRILLCKSGDGPSCLSSAQVEAVRKIYAGATNPRTGKAINPGYEPGSELQWGTLTVVEDDGFKYIVFNNPDWDFKIFDFDRDVALADKQDHGILNATDSNLKDFVSQGGKLILYQGWADQFIEPQGTINYYDDVVRAVGHASGIQKSVRLFMAPGMTHCDGGEGPNDFDVLHALEQWVEQDKAPDKLIASHSTDGKIDRTRPLCPYPQVARYTGTGSTDDATNFICKAP